MAADDCWVVRFMRSIPIWNSSGMRPSMPGLCGNAASASTTAPGFFDGPVLIWEDARRDYGEERFRAVGETAGDILHVAFAWRGDRIRIISVRRANRKETELWRRRN